jgi:DNA-directed RNA polymerase subunit omega
MARVTIEDCLKRIDNAYDIVTLASQRAKDILDGSEPKLDYDGKPSVIALKEIAEGLIDMSYFDTRRKEQIEDQLSDAIAEEEAIADITAESQQIIQDDSDTGADSHHNSEAAPEETSSQSPENTEDKPL